MNKNFKKGFGLLEVLVAGVIIITILAALVFVGQTALESSSNSQERAQAIYLAQDGIEKIRQIRDTNWIDRDNTTQWNSLAWDNASSTFIIPVDGSCHKIITPSLPTTKFALTPVVSSDCGKDIVANQAAWEEIVIDNIAFKRVVKIENVAELPTASGKIEDSAMKVTVYVQWQGRKGYQDPPILVSEMLTNWRPNY